MNTRMIMTIIIGMYVTFTIGAMSLSPIVAAEESDDIPTNAQNTGQHDSLVSDELICNAPRTTRALVCLFANQSVPINTSLSFNPLGDVDNFTIGYSGILDCNN